MLQGYSISVVIPCHNEERGIGKVLDKIPSFVDEVVVVDNASTDNTAKVSMKKGARVIHEKEKGYGKALITGFHSAKGSIIVTADGDMTYPVDKISTLVKTLLEGNEKFISGARFPLTHKKSMQFRNRVGNRILTLAIRILCFRKVNDAMSGMWAFYREILPALNLKSKGIPLSAEIKMKAIMNKNIGFREVHIPYFERIGRSKLYPWRDGVKTLFVMLRIKFSGC